MMQWYTWALQNRLLFNYDFQNLGYSKQGYINEEFLYSLPRGFEWEDIRAHIVSRL